MYSVPGSAPYTVCPTWNGVARARLSLGSTSPTLPVTGIVVPVACSVHDTYSAPRRGPFVRSTAIEGKPPQAGPCRSELGVQSHGTFRLSCTLATTNGAPKLAPWSVDLR